MKYGPCVSRLCTSGAVSALKVAATHTHWGQCRRWTTQSRRREGTRYGCGHGRAVGGRGCWRESDSRGRDEKWCRTRWRHRWSSAREPRGWRRLQTRWGSSRLYATMEFCEECLPHTMSLVKTALLLQGSHSIGYKYFHDFPRTPEAFFQDPVVRQRCLNIKTNSSY